MKSVLASSVTDIGKYVEEVPEINEGVMSATQTKAMTK